MLADCNNAEIILSNSTMSERTSMGTRNSLLLQTICSFIMMQARTEQKEGFV
jgi:hypothetical protein